MLRMDRINRLQPSECPPGLNKHARHHLATVLRRLDYLSQMIRAKPVRPGSGDYRLEEFDALAWLLAKVVGQDLVDRWMGKYEVEVPGYRPGKHDGEAIGGG